MFVDNMAFCRPAVSVLILLLYLHGVVCAPASAEVTVKAYLNDSATLPCSGQHSGTVVWVMLEKPDHVVAWCNQTSCWSEHGFEMSHDNYRNGTFSLNITAVEHSNAGLYQCLDDHKIISDVRLKVENIPSINVDRYHSVVLPCHGISPGLVTWVKNDKPSDPLAECDRTSCRSVKEGYQMIYDQYLQGDFSLIITEADFSKRGNYTCQCDSFLFRVQLLINPLNSPVHIQSGDSLVLALDLHDPLEVIYKRSGAAHQTSVQICTLYGRSLHCIDKYKNRVFLHSALELSGMNVSDSGVYTMRTIENKEDIHIYTVNVTDYQRPPLPSPLDGKVICISFFLCISVIINVILVVRLCVLKRQHKKANVTCVLKNRCCRNEDANESTAEEQILQTEQQ
ncbi:hypothetical protein AMEX_G25168 [Astyanax mexicanus]|uniref:Ig-like domain-containing protein n=1 Tax=Astyanax mexicanus TaxID=7994 RepID=A0A8T2KV62_ASTMX|nr:hypothetical protein AMEX_G25168 [Astyanax mexicanus]